MPNPQGSDLAKAVLHFHKKKPLGSQGVFWLKVHIANSYGFDKERFADRARWTEQNWHLIEKALDEPENHLDVWGTDAPWCMFAAAYELREAYRSGDPTTYRTGIPVHMDATCSGLQHFSALLRDPVGGQYVNLIDTAQCGPKQDIYARVAQNALLAIQQDMLSDDPETAAKAAWWFGVGIPRGLAKKPVKS
jgi:DNA-directed RNA polymerase